MAEAEIQTVEDEDGNTFVVETGPPVKPLSYIKANDILKITKRLLKKNGDFSILDVYDACRSRIPGTLEQYAATIHALNRQRRIT